MIGFNRPKEESLGWDWNIGCHEIILVTGRSNLAIEFAYN